MERGVDEDDEDVDDADDAAEASPFVALLSGPYRSTLIRSVVGKTPVLQYLPPSMALMSEDLPELNSPTKQTRNNSSIQPDATCNQ